MSAKTYGSRLAAAALLLCTYFDAAGETMQKRSSTPAGGKGRTQMIDQLEDPSETVREAAVSKILKSRDADIDQIVGIVERSVPQEGKKAIARDNIVLLGRLRATKAVPVLVRLLTFQVPYLATRPQTIDDSCPAAGALIEIGSPALAPVLERIRNEDGDILQWASAAVFRGVLGERWASLVLEKEIQNSLQPEKEQRLRQVLEKLHRLPK
jgi:HEAT repeat protein